MNCVIVGSKERDTEEDRALVGELMEKAAAYYPNCLFVTMLTSVGVGLFVKQKCTEKNGAGKFRFQCVACDVKIYASNLTHAESSAVYLARNATVFELGSLFYYFASEDRRGTMEDLIMNRVAPAGLPYKIFAPGDPVELIPI